MITLCCRASSPKILPLFAGLAAFAVAIAAAPATHASIHVQASQAGTKVNATDGKCSFYEAIDAINSGKVNAGDSKNGCVNDEFGGPYIVVEGNGAHYKTFGAIITRKVEIWAYAPNNFAYLEHSGPSAVITNRAGTDSDRVYISGFTIQHTGTGQGRVIENSGVLDLNWNTIKGGIITGNSGTAAYGGGIYNTGEINIYECGILSNKAKRGGGIYTTSVAGIGIERSSVTNNSATETGGGMWTSGRLNVDTVTVSDNTATGNGGGVYCAAGPANSYCSFRFSTIANNKGAKGGGVYRFSDANCTNLGTCSATETAASIFAGNKTTGGAADDYFGDPRSNDGGVSQATDVALFQSFTGTVRSVDQNGVKFDKTGNPGFGSLLNNFGSVTRSRSISSTGPAKDAARTPGCPSQDQNFTSRPSGPHCDFGAYEIQQ